MRAPPHGLAGRSNTPARGTHTVAASRLVVQAWFYRPVHVAQGFETSFTFSITPSRNSTVVDENGNPRGADGFAFVLQRDARTTSALGGSGTGLGLAGLEGSLAVQFCTTPSCAKRRKRVKREGEEEEEESLLCQYAPAALYHITPVLSPPLSPPLPKTHTVRTDTRTPLVQVPGRGSRPHLPGAGVALGQGVRVPVYV